MEKVKFQDVDCYVAFEVLQKNMRNFQDNFTYETGNWFSAIDVDQTQRDYSFGSNLFDNELDAFIFMPDGIILKCFVPVESNMVTFIENESKFRCKRFYLTEEIVKVDIDKYWNELTEYQKNRICEYNQNLDIDKYWDELIEDQKDLICQNNQNLDVDKYWKKLTENQRNYICINYVLTI